MTLKTARFSVRIFGTMVLLVLGLGYLLAMVYLFSGHIKHFVSEGATVVEAVEYTYHGLPTEEPRLLVSLRGSMASTVSAPEFDSIRAWINDGALEATYPDRVGPIIEKNCVSCHRSGEYYPQLEGYADLLPLTSPDKGMDVAKLARMTHVHLLGIPLLFYIIGALFVRTRFNEKLKAGIVVLPFVGILIDILSWWLTKANDQAAIGVIVGGSLMSLGFTLQWFMTMFDIWFRHKDGDDAPSSFS